MAAELKCNRQVAFKGESRRGGGQTIKYGEIVKSPATYCSAVWQTAPERRAATSQTRRGYSLETDALNLRSVAQCGRHHLREELRLLKRDAAAASRLMP